MTIENFSCEYLLEISKNFKIAENESYVETYPFFLEYFSNIQSIEEHHLVIATHFVYGWMPRILHLDLTNRKEILMLLNKAKSGYLLNKDELETLKGGINNSMVGVSKLLHFINPSIYAIWDSNIYRFLSGRKSSYNIGQPSSYLSYLKTINEITEHSEFPKLHSIISQNFHYEIYPTRAIEILIFETERARRR